jgi:tripartite-type tricarboxylate transporter receptor subunit TctC
VGIDYVRFGWLGVCAAEGTPQPIIDRLNREIALVVATADYKNMIENAGSIAASSTPRELKDVIAQTLDEIAAAMQEFDPQQKQ